MTAIAVTRQKLPPRVVSVPVVDTDFGGGDQHMKRVNAVEGVQYESNCGCVCKFAVRMDNAEKTLGYWPCERHKQRSSEFLSRFTAPDSPAIETGAWMAMLLQDLERIEL